jgi:hypothetical protein
MWGDYSSLRTLLHPEGSCTFISNRPRTVSDRDELVKALQLVRETTSYRVYTLSYEVLGGGVVLASAYIRTPAGHGGDGHGLARHFFLIDVKDGLLYRQEHFHVERDARMAFADHWGRDTRSQPMPAHSLTSA